MNLLTLETERLVLTGISHENMKYIFDHLPISEIKELLGHRSDADYSKELQKHINGYSSYNRRFMLFLLKVKASGTLIGRCGLHNWNAEHQRAEIGYVIEDENFKRKAFMNEALKSIIHYGFHQLNMNRIEALVAIDNTPSIQLLEKNHFKKEGILKQHMYSADRFADSILYALLKGDYEKTQKHNKV